MKRILPLLLALALLTGCSPAAPAPTPEPTPDPNSMTGDELMLNMKIGWNLGNTFDAPDGETSWGNPITTQAMFTKLKELGFNTVRIPISWHKHTSAAPEYTIDEVFMERVDTVVNWALDAGLYVIINSHHDNDVYSPTPDNAETGKTFLHAIWTQVGEHFKDAPYELIFQTMNEPRVVGASYEWTVDVKNPKCMAAVEVINELNQTSLDAIRATGNRNADRFVIISPYAGSPTGSLNDTFRIPEDSAEGKLILSVHAYTPYNLALNINSTESTFTKNHRSEIRTTLRSVDYKFSKLGIPFIVDEMGCINKDNPEDRYAWAKAYISIAREFNAPCIWWDNGCITGSGERFGLFDRRSLIIYPASQRAYEGLMEGLSNE